MTSIVIYAIIIDIENKQLANTATFKEELKMTTQKEQTQDAKMIQLALYREYGFQPCLKDIEILESVENPDFPWHLERAYVEIKGHFYTIYQNEFGGLTVQKY